MKSSAAALVVFGVGGVACAQTGLGTLTWEADDGTGWRAGLVETTQPSVMVRLVAAWTPEAGDAFAGCQFDVVVSAASDADGVSAMVRPSPVHRGLTQTIVASRFGSTIKIDDARDTSPPGQGVRGVFPGQLAPQFGDTVTTNPITIFEFRLTFGDAPGVRRVSNLYLAPPGGNTTDRVMRIYDGFGRVTTPSTTSFTLDVVYVPGPGMVGMGLAGVTLAGLRRRR